MLRKHISLGGGRRNRGHLIIQELCWDSVRKRGYLYVSFAYFYLILCHNVTNHMFILCMLYFLQVWYGCLMDYFSLYYNINIQILFLIIVRQIMGNRLQTLPENIFNKTTKIYTLYVCSWCTVSTDMFLKYNYLFNIVYKYVRGVMMQWGNSTRNRLIKLFWFNFLDLNGRTHFKRCHFFAYYHDKLLSQKFLKFTSVVKSLTVFIFLERCLLEKSYFH